MEFHILGPVALRIDGRLLELGSDKERTLLAALALEVGRSVPLETLIERLWDGDPPQHARENTHSYISRLRRRLRPTGQGGSPTPTDPDQRPVEGADGGAPLIVGRAHTYSLEVADPDCVDWHRFQRLVETSADGDDLRAVEVLDQAERLWRGEALAGLPGLWAETARRTLAERRLAATVSRAAAGLRLGRFGDLVGELSALAENHPEDETLLGQLALAYYGSGRYTEALRVHQRARQLLMAEYGVRPGPELDRIHRGILEQRPVENLVRVPAGAGRQPAPAPPAPAPARSQRAEPPARPAPPSPLPPSSVPSTSIPSTSGPVPSPTPPPGGSPPFAPRLPAPRVPDNLPYQPPLVGRTAELRALSEAVGTAPVGVEVTDEAHGLVVSLETVSGMAGVGKTAIAVHTASRLSGRFPDGVLYLNMMGHSSAQKPLTPGAALSDLLRLLGAPAQTIPLELPDQAALWRRMLADRRAIIVLDDAFNSAQITPLLPGGSPSLVIVTSRRHLTLPYARAVPLDVLQTPDAIALFHRFAGRDRTGDVEEVARIVDLCGNLPLAIELVAKRFQTRTSWTPATLVERLARPGRLAEIRDDGNDGNEMVRAFDLSYQPLTEAQRTAFRRLGLHPGPDFTADVAAAMLGQSPASTERLLEDLLTCHLLTEPTPDRFRFHDLLREYARQLAGSDDDAEDRAQAVRRLTDFYLQAAERADRLAYPRRIRLSPVPGPAPGPGAGSDKAPLHLPSWPTPEAARGWLSTERANLLAAETHAYAHGDPERAARLAYAIAGSLDAECHWSDAATVLQHAATHWAVTGAKSHLCRALIGLSDAQARTARYPEAARTAERALEVARATGDEEAEAEVLLTAGKLHWHLGENLTALGLFQRSFALTEAAADGWVAARGHNNIAITLLFLGEHHRALSHFQKAVTGFRQASDHASVGKALNNIGDLHLREGDADAARRSFQEALSILEDVGNRYDQATARKNLADALRDLGDIPGALSLYQTTLAQFSSLGDRRSESGTLVAIGEAHRMAGANAEAVRFHSAALKLARTIGSADEVAQSFRGLGQAHLALGEVATAAGQLRSAVEVATRTHNLDEAVLARESLAEVHAVTGDVAAARALLEEALDSLRGRESRVAATRIHNRLAELGAALKRPASN